MHKTVSPIVISGGDDGTGDGIASLDFSGWTVTWNFIPAISMGSGANTMADNPDWPRFFHAAIAESCINMRSECGGAVKVVACFEDPVAIPKTLHGAGSREDTHTPVTRLAILVKQADCK